MTTLRKLLLVLEAHLGRALDAHALALSEVGLLPANLETAADPDHTANLLVAVMASDDPNTAADIVDRCNDLRFDGIYNTPMDAHTGLAVGPAERERTAAITATFADGMADIISAKIASGQTQCVTPSLATRDGIPSRGAFSGRWTAANPSRTYMLDAVYLAAEPTLSGGNRTLRWLDAETLKIVAAALSGTVRREELPKSAVVHRWPNKALCGNRLPS